jgi:hypothetical protein
MMRRRPSICDACSRLRQTANPAPTSSADRYHASCQAFPSGIPADIYTGGFDHRRPHPGDSGIRFLPRPGAETALSAFERSWPPLD